MLSLKYIEEKRMEITFRKLDFMTITFKSVGSGGQGGAVPKP